MGHHENFDALVSEHRIISVSEVRNELGGHGDRLSDWVKDHREFFLTPTTDELRFVAEIFKIAHFQMLVRKRERNYSGMLIGLPIAILYFLASKNNRGGRRGTQSI